MTVMNGRSVHSSHMTVWALMTNALAHDTLMLSGLHCT